ncbi:heat shock 70 kDa protein 4-like isoform X1 [Ctenocephalides felis]|uniref:heat shock 70 kDa protein 4-like isoform X1 n=1 Tax=Ctenocephalides felis TaxID=7515 RepID=UPI000E6E12E9|nr:heat shock 70 kDa protein 4-like isoform X1 [Ctenocephalides felis]
MAAMSVIGIDFGNESCYVAVAKSGGIETIANDYSLRGTPSCVAFSGKNRVLGVAAKNQLVTNMKNTVWGFKRLLGRRYNDPHVQNELRSLPFRTEQRPDGGIGIRVHYLDEEHVFSPEQVTAMLFTKLKETSANALQTQVNDCVISVPSYFTNAERRALLDAASIAGLNVLRLMNETTATALAYGIYKQDLPAPEDKPRNVVFVDCGHASLQVYSCAFHRGKLRMIACASDPHCGGRDIDMILAEHFCNEFKSRYRIDAKSNARAYIRLLAEVEKIKKQMSANSTKLPLNIECFMEDKDVHSEMQRSIMEELCAGLFQRVGRTLKKCLDDSKLRLDEIHSVEIVGGSSRIPYIKHLIESVFGKSPSTTLNQDEAVARGAALQCAMLSPAVRVRDFSVTDIQNYPVKLVWDASAGEEGEMEVFPAYHAAPFSKMLTFYRKEPFAIKAVYSHPVPFPDPLIGSWTIRDIRPTPEGESQKIKIKVRVNIHGIVHISSACLLEKHQSNEPEAMQQEQEGVENMDQENSKSEPNGGSGCAGNEEVGLGDTAQEAGWAQRVTQWFSSDKKKEKKITVKSTELPIDAYTHGYTQSDLNNYFEQECKMISSDKQEKERADARNALEEYVYELRGKLQSEDQLAMFLPEQERSQLCSDLDAMENWLYEDGEDCQRQIYFDKLTALRTQGEPVKARRLEYDLRPSALEELGQAIQLGRKAVDMCNNKDPRYDHLTDSDINKVAMAVEAAYKWLEEKRTILASTPKTINPPITVQQIRQEKQTLDQAIIPILNKPKPKAPTPPATQQAEEEGTNSNAQGDNQSPPEDKMDVE